MKHTEERVVRLNGSLQTVILVAMAFAPAVMPACAQDFPSRPIRVIVASGAGGGTDLTGRNVVKTLTEKPKGSTHWSTRDMAKASGMSQPTVSRLSLIHI